MAMFGRVGTVLAAAMLVSACGDQDAPSRTDRGGETSAVQTFYFGEMLTGEATYYDFADGSGACSFDPSPEDMNVAALNSQDWWGSGWCGACADVEGPNGSVLVRIVDLCPECPSGHLDLSPQAFDQIAERSAGRVPITWHLEPCIVDGPVRYRYKDGANQWWTAVQVLNHRLPIRSLEWSADGSSWNPTERQSYNYFLDSNGFGPDPVRVRITAVSGQTLEDELPTVQEYLVVDGHAQFD
jgi:expansin (peptidoglycan-binding protein)